MKQVFELYYLSLFDLHVCVSNKTFKIIKCASYYVMSLIVSNMVLYEYDYILLINNNTYYLKTNLYICI